MPTAYFRPSGATVYFKAPSKANSPSNTQQGGLGGSNFTTPQQGGLGSSKPPSLGLSAPFKSAFNEFQGFKPNSAPSVPTAQKGLNIGQLGTSMTYKSALGGPKNNNLMLGNTPNPSPGPNFKTENMLRGIGLGLEGLNVLSGIAGLAANIWSTSEQIKMAKEHQKLAKQQFEEENRRYNTRESERLENNKQIANSASFFESNPMERP
ncbi:hypothetical protein [Helicobacter felis]|uniref:hypothetical protein n=1 Tax=Helicobacter felis TaxID=214 RepID=UPI000EF6BD0C|nr:hypothetical protein [Helicobacter felis]